MIQQVIMLLLVVIILLQIGVLRFDTLTTLFQETGYESDDDIEIYRKSRSRRGKTKSKRKDPHMTPIESVMITSKGSEIDPDDPEEIQRAIMNELNQHDALFLTPTPI